jgi:hypothetical protein
MLKTEEVPGDGWRLRNVELIRCLLNMIQVTKRRRSYVILGTCYIWERTNMH